MTDSKSGGTTKATVYVRLRDGVLDPQGVTIQKALTQMGYSEILSVRSGKFFELEVSTETDSIDARLDEVCSRLLTNPVIESYSVVRDT